MRISGQFALYPLKQQDVGEVLAEALREFDRLGISYRVGRMSTELQGEDEEVFQALREAFRRAASHGEAVLVATISNACGEGDTHAVEEPPSC